MQGVLLLLSPEEHLRWVLARGLSRVGYRVISVQNGNEAVQQLEREAVNLVIVDLDGPGSEGMPVLHRLLGVRSNVPFLVLTGQASAETALEAQRLGARDYLQKPFSLDELRLALEKALEIESLRQEVRFLRLEAAGRRENVELIGVSPAMRAIRELIAQVADARAPVTVVGEAGTGKEVVARAIHHQSRRREYPFVVFPCAAIPPNLLESELFGWEPPGPAKAGNEAKVRSGRLELAHRGTLLIRDIELLPLDLQVRLCRVLEDGAFTRIGGTRQLAVDVRVIVASSRSLADAVREGRMREDLYYRLNVIPIHLPPLSVRKEDIADLARHFLCRYEPRGRIRGFTADAVHILTGYAWPGNVRELANRIERAVIITRGEWITAAELTAVDPPCIGQKETGLNTSSANGAAASTRRGDQNRRSGEVVTQVGAVPHEQGDIAVSSVTRDGTPLLSKQDSGTAQRRSDKANLPAQERPGETVVLNQGKELLLYTSRRRRRVETGAGEDQPSSAAEREKIAEGDGTKAGSGRRTPHERCLQSDGVTLTIAGPFSLENVEKKIIESALQETGGDLVETARMLGLNRPALSARMQKHHISLTPFRSGER
ncbi:two component, sigma54 specific, transcriptional regulator, fis family [Heliomicrobium modesticaldum Ice1]|uniref:Stage 0 sporulation protein A homolog n=1 Tax=Heliobacterium modesticaldum (strain ATCC 51547 / Ice1) TaxID=498761 RepID=B0TF38_HELMI|nr:sigma 54-interacting transcriptional regulator [Heliomicrobium modesticaldum]ABZ83021.1 two component, sigma54 specific, transcriptional regulator, fis family [Heliomicrobium modesticaldum Ice1]